MTSPLGPRRFFLLLLLSLAGWQCASDQAIRAPRPHAEMVKGTDHTLEEVGEGYALYQRKCAECHEHRIPTLIPPADQHLLVQGMALNAGLSREDEDNLQAYLSLIADR